MIIRISLLLPLMCMLGLNLTSCSDSTKEEEFEEFVKDELNETGYEGKVRKYLLNHYNFANEDKLLYEDEFDTNNVCISSNDQYSFRIVKKDKEDYDDGYKVYCTKGYVADSLLKIFESSIYSLGSFLWRKEQQFLQQDGNSKDDYKKLLTSENRVEMNRLITNRFTYINAYLKYLKLDTINNDYVFYKLCNYTKFDAIIIKLKDGTESFLYHPDGQVFQLNYDPAKLTSLGEISKIAAWAEGRLDAGAFESNFLQKCKNHEYENCNKAHSLNLFIIYKGKLYGVDKWKNIL
jgi:hypothetical protein